MAPTLGAHPGDTLRVSTGFASKGGVTGWAAQTGTPTFRGSHYGTGHALMAGRGLYRNVSGLNAVRELAEKFDTKEKCKV